MAYPPGIFSSFTQGMMIPQQFKMRKQQLAQGKLSMEQARENLLKSQILNKYTGRRQEAQLQKMADVHQSQLRAAQVDPALAKEKHMLNLANIYSKTRPRAPLVQVGFDPSGRPVSQGAPSGAPSGGTPRGGPGVPPVLQQYLMSQGMGQGMGGPQAGRVPRPPGAPQIPPSLPSPAQEMAVGGPQAPAAFLPESIPHPATPMSKLEAPSVTAADHPSVSVAKDDSDLSADEQFFANLMTGTKRGAIGKQFRTKSGITFTPIGPTRIDKIQGANLAIDNMLPLLEDIKNIARGNLIGGRAWNPDVNARLDAKINSAVETNIAGFGLSGTDFGRKLSHSQIAPHLAESEGSYLKRLDDFAYDFERRRDINNKLLRVGGTITYPKGKDPRKKKKQKVYKGLTQEQLFRIAEGK